MLTIVIFDIIMYVELYLLNNAVLLHVKYTNPTTCVVIF